MTGHLNFSKDLSKYGQTTFLVERTIVLGIRQLIVPCIREKNVGTRKEKSLKVERLAAKG